MHCDKIGLAIGICWLASGSLAAEVSSAFPVLLPERLDIGNTNIKPLQPIDSAAWIWSEAPGKVRIFRNRFQSPGEKVRIHVSADNRYVLKLDGERIARGPERGTLDHWTYRTLELTLAPGEHVIDAVVQRLEGRENPLAQLNWWKTGGFILKAEGRLDAALSTGTGNWKAKAFDNVEMANERAGSFGIGGSNVITGSSPWFAKMEDAEFGPVTVVREKIKGSIHGCPADGWSLYPTTLPPQYERVLTPGTIKSVTRGTPNDYAPLFRGESVTVPANSEEEILWDLENYYCAYPEVETSGGKGARIDFGWAESLAEKDGRKNDRAAYEGKTAKYFNDVFVSDGGEDGFTTTWWRAGRWVRLLVKTADAAITLRRLAIAEVHYATPFTHSFVCDDASIAPVIGICERAMQMCSHEMGFDCPFYEQQMYTGDTRLQLLIQGVLFDDDRLIRRDLELFDYSRRGDGMVGFNFPTFGTQQGFSYSVIWPMMLGDYALWHDNVAWLKYRFPGLVHTMEGCRNFENEEGLAVNAPGWNFQDWTTWPKGGTRGCAPDANGTNCFNNLLYAYALKSAALVSEVVGEPAFAAIYRERFARTTAAIQRRFWSEARGMLADDLGKSSFSEHNLSMALLLDFLPQDRAESCARQLMDAPDLVPTTVYFSHYLFDAYAKIGRADQILKRLDLWRGYVARHLKTTPESPEKPTGGKQPRSDCHAWGAHPLFHLHASILGIRPAAPCFAKVRIAPQPGTLRQIAAVTPTPKGDIRSDLRFSGKAVSGTIELPKGLTGEFVWQGTVRPLLGGKNSIGNAH